MRLALRILLAGLVVVAGALHFIVPKGFERIVPSYLPAPALLVQVSGVCELAFGVGLLFPATQRWAAWGLVALFVAVFPANVNMALHHIGFGRQPGPAWLLWARLPLQGVLVAWAYLFT